MALRLFALLVALANVAAFSPVGIAATRSAVATSVVTMAAKKPNPALFKTGLEAKGAVVRGQGRKPMGKQADTRGFDGSWTGLKPWEQAQKVANVKAKKTETALKYGSKERPGAGKVSLFNVQGGRSKNPLGK